MNYDSSGLGYTELSLVAMYLPQVYFDEVYGLAESSPREALALARKALAAYTDGMIEE